MANGVSRLNAPAPAAPARPRVDAARAVPSASEHEADRMADAALAGTAPRAARARAIGDLPVPQAARSVLAGPGQALAPPLRHDMEQRFGHDFSRVRIHADAPAQQSARALSAQAYTVGPHIAFGRGRHAPLTTAGRQLLAHELAHVVQQGTGPAVLQRKLDLNDFDTGDFSLPSLQAYLAKVGPGRIEDKRDSDDKARAIVALWRKGQMALTAQQKIALIQEMQSGFTGNDDERAILTLLLNTPAEELPALFAAKGGLDPQDLDSDFHGAEEKALRSFYDEHFIGGRKAALGGARTLRQAKADEPAVTAPAAAKADEAPKPAGPPRQDFVFIMGNVKTDEFYREAHRYFKAHRPQATFVTDKRSLAAVLSHIASTVTAPIGNLYLVSHANEDGTLSFALDGDDKNKKLSVTELRKALRPAGGGPSALSAVAKQVDAHTVVRIKGCDIGRTKEMLDLLDEAFGGAGTVTAPTHEQVYGTDSTLGDRADAAFREAVTAKYAQPPAVDKTLKGKELQAAKAARAKAMGQRGTNIKAELKARDKERKGVVAQAQQYEAFSGPMFQRTGETLFTAGELMPELERLYPHLSDKQRASLAKRLVAKDRRAESKALKDGTYKQVGQRLYRRVFPSTYWEPADAKGFLALHRSIGGKVPKGFQPGAVTARDTTDDEGKAQRTYELEGSFADGSTQTFELNAPPVPTVAEHEQTARGALNNPDRYAWSTTRAYNPKTGKVTLKAVATRVLAYLHHASLDAAKHMPFDRDEPDPDFYAQSTFAPPAAPKP